MLKLNRIPGIRVICNGTLLMLSVFGMALASAADDGEWQSLFNGKNLEGWKQLNGEALYTVSNGEIIGTTVANTPNSFLATTEDYGDFILELELLVDPSLNSGIQFRSESLEHDRHGRVHGYQMEVDPSARAWSGGIYDEARRGWLYPMDYNPDGKKAFKNNEWNKYRIECVGNTLRTWVNGIPTANVVDAESSRGFIALQVHAIGKADQAGKQVRWRNIRIQTKNLKPSPMDDIFVVHTIPNNLSAQESANGYVLLFDGKTTNGWRGAYMDYFPKQGWLIEDGELKGKFTEGGESSSSGDIVTEKKYKNFALVFDWKLGKGGNSGVKYFIEERLPHHGGSPIGYEYQLIDDANYIYEGKPLPQNLKTASIYDVVAAQKEDVKLATWHTSMIVVNNDHIEHWLDGKKVVEADRRSEWFRKNIEQSKFKDFEGFADIPEGHIMLQDHGFNVSFRSIKLKQLN